MFIASIAVCAFWINNSEPDCKILRDSWGPYKTLDNCRIRTRQMEKDLFTGEPVPVIAIILNFPDLILHEQICEHTGDQPV